MQNRIYSSSHNLFYFSNRINLIRFEKSVSSLERGECKILFISVFTELCALTVHVVHKEKEFLCKFLLLHMLNDQLKHISNLLIYICNLHVLNKFVIFAFAQWERTI